MPKEIVTLESLNYRIQRTCEECEYCKLGRDYDEGQLYSCALVKNSSDKVSPQGCCDKFKEWKDK